MRIVIAGGGTAGHVNPALALAAVLSSDGDDVVFVGTIEGLEARLVTAANLPFETIDVVGFDRARPTAAPAVAGRALKAVGTARRILGRLRPDVVVGMGGYVSLPVSLAAASRRIPLVLHEQNIVLGLAHNVTKTFARRIAVSFEATLVAVGSKGVLTGNPVSADLASLDRAARRDHARTRFGLAPDVPTVLIFGGSLGARRLNAAALELADLWSGRQDRQILHITGRAEASQVPQGHDPRIGYAAFDFVDGMADAYAAADVAVCRGGASTVAELTAVALPAVVVPYPHHRDRQQQRHAEVLQSGGAGIAVADAAATGARIAREVERMLEPDVLNAMVDAARLLGRPDAARRLTEVVRASR